MFEKFYLKEREFDAKFSKNEVSEIRRRLFPLRVPYKTGKVQQRYFTHFPSRQDPVFLNHYIN